MELVINSYQKTMICKNHDKVYAKEQIMTAPPKIKWICRKCLEEGIDTIGEYREDEYNKLKRLKEIAV